MDYWSLVNMLMNQITPETRAIILEKLTEMNNSLLSKNNISGKTIYERNLEMDLSRTSSMNARKKDLDEQIHPSLDIYRNNSVQHKILENPIPLNIPINSNNQYVNDHYKYEKTNNYQQTDKQIDLDDIIHDIDDDMLNEKLDRIKHLYQKIISDKKKRKATGTGVTYEKL